GALHRRGLLCGGSLCSARVQLIIGGKVVSGETDTGTGKLTVLLPAAGEGTLTVSRHGKRVVVPFTAAMGAQLTTCVDLQAHVLISLRRAAIGPRNDVVLKLKNLGYRASRVHFRVWAHEGRLNGPTDMSLFLGAGKSRSWLIEVAASSATYVVASDVQWQYGHGRALLYAPGGERACDSGDKPIDDTEGVLVQNSKKCWNALEMTTPPRHD
ncbi:MAG: hypothetical protein LAO22_15950, partial [Acidobacteriia bacterium]|nr:hypothetical protein [Terriglobia bacterium]